MPVETILAIILTAEQIVLEVIRGVPLAEREKIWREHQAHVAWWRAIFRPQDPPPVESGGLK